MKVLHILAGGEVGGIEVLCKEFGKYSKHDNIFLFLWSEGTITYEMKKHGLKTISLKASKKELFSPFFKILKICRDNKIDVVVEHHTAIIAHMYLILLKKIIPTIQVVAYLHCSVDDICSDTQKMMWLRKIILKKSFNNAKKIVAISKSVRSSFFNHFSLPKDKIVVNYNGVKIYENEDDRIKVNNSEVVQLIYVGRLIYEKGVQNTLKALATLDNKLKYRFIIVGDGPYRKKLEHLKSELKLDSVYFYGQRRDVPNLLQKSDIFVHCPNWQEGFGISIIEAMSEGVICLCNDSGAIPEIITDGKTGFIVKQGDNFALEQKLSEVISGVLSKKYASIKLNARNRARDFSIISFSERLDTIIAN